VRKSVRRLSLGISGSGTRSIADFTFIKRVSRGAFGSVFLASRARTGDIFAIKATPHRTLKQKNQIQRVLIEKDILLRFSSEYIVRFYYSFVGLNNLYLVTEFVPGGDLYSLLQHVGSLPEEAAQIYGIQIVYALKYLRSNGIIHRDIKPDNILVTADGHLKLTDFGLSYLGMVDRQISDEEIHTSQSFVGTPDYVAPEIILSRPHSFSVDYWSLGIILYEFIYGEPPFHGDDEHQTYKNVVFLPLRFPTDTEVSPEFVDLITKLLDRSPISRLGHKSIDDILSHPWFEDVDPSGEAPFVPELTSATDTNYFQQRYAFNNDEDASILQDLHECTESPRPSTLASYSSMDIAELGLANLAVAEQMTGRLRESGGSGTLEVEPEEGADDTAGRKRRDSPKGKTDPNLARELARGGKR
jgi:serine/threonine protein kinase